MADIITKEIIVKGDSKEVYTLWTNFENFPQFMNNVKSVTTTGKKTSHWVVHGPLGKDIEWDAQITDLRENKSIAWNSLDGNIKISGQVTFNQLTDTETQLTLTIHYVPPAGKIGEIGAYLLDNPEKKIADDLRRFKQYAEDFFQLKES